MPEDDFYHWLKRRVQRTPIVDLGIGDDAAVLRHGRGTEEADLVVTSDLLAEGVHFASTADPRQVGRKALAVNLSDLAAMGARPTAAAVALLGSFDTLPEVARAVMEGIEALARQFDVAVVGGDTNSWKGPLVVSVTTLGDLEGRTAMKRNGAQIGDQLLVTGTLGGSIAGQHLTFMPRVAEGERLAAIRGVHAAMDISDGLLLDAGRIATASNVAIVIQKHLVPISPAAHNLAATDPSRSALDHALSDGEDFELLLSVAPGTATTLLKSPPSSIGLTSIGFVVQGHGLWAEDESGKRSALTPAGYEHLK